MFTGRLDPEASIAIFLAVYLSRKCLSRVATLQIITGWSTCNSIKDIMIIHNLNYVKFSINYEYKENWKKNCHST